MLVVMALGGNALLRRGEPLEADVQRRNLLAAVARSVAPIASRHRLVITHGNGPQVGLLALQAAAYKDVEPYPLDVLGAESEGMIGYLIEQALANELAGREIATLLTQVEVDGADAAFARPSKPIGPAYGAVTDAGLEAQRLAMEHEGIALEPTYTAKCMAALLDLAARPPYREQTVLFWNTYNSVDVEAVVGPLPDWRSLPEPFHKFWSAAACRRFGAGAEGK